MYNQFITFIVVLFICATYQPQAKTSLSLLETVFLFFLFLLLFIVSNRLSFKKVEKNIDKVSFTARDREFENAVMRQTVVAVVLFTITLYLLCIPDFLLRISLFSLIPTLTTVVCLCIFLVFMTAIYKAAHDVYQKIYHHRIPLGSFIRSNLSFCIPVLLPWLVLSFSSDILRLLPFGGLNDFLASPAGELIFLIVVIFVIATVGPFFIQKLWRCKPLEPGYRRERLSRLCKFAKMEYKDILYWTLFGGKMVTAGVMGLTKAFRYILVTPALMQMLDDGEIDAVMAHEIGHVKKKHMLFYIVLFIGYVVLSYFILHVVDYAMIYARLSFEPIDTPGTDPASAISLLFIFIFIISFVLYFRFIFGFFMRNFERQADTYVYHFFDSAAGLISSLEKIALASGIPKDKPNWHHFSIKERIGFLTRCEKDKSRIVRHDKKVKTGIIVYLICLIFLGTVEFGLNFTEMGLKLTNVMIKKAILTELEKTPDDPLLYGSLGDIYQAGRDYEKAVLAYEKALALHPENPHVLNNLAWLLVTCKDPLIKDPEKALVLAKKAASLDASPHILDTLAESYFATGHNEKAIEIIRAAIELAMENKRYYLNQLEKFKSAGE